MAIYHRAVTRSLRRIFVASLVLTLPLAFGAPVHGAGPSAVLVVTLNGQDVRPKADPNGFGNAKVSLYPTKVKVCISLTVGNIARAEGLAIHKAAPGLNGPEVLALEAPGYRTIMNSCNEGVNEDLIRDMAANPGSYYVVVRTCQYTWGAIRGQLKLRT